MHKTHTLAKRLIKVIKPDGAHHHICASSVSIYIVRRMNRARVAIIFLPKLEGTAGEFWQQIANTTLNAFTYIVYGLYYIQRFDDCDNGGRRCVDVRVCMLLDFAKHCDFMERGVGGGAEWEVSKGGSM